MAVILNVRYEYDFGLNKDIASLFKHSFSFQYY